MHSLRRADFEQAFSSGKSVGGRTVALKLLERGEGPARVGLAVGKRLEKRAAHRNRVRRRLREALRTLPLRDGYDVVVLAQRPAMSMAFAPLCRELRRSLARAGLLEEPTSA